MTGETETSWGWEHCTRCGTRLGRCTCGDLAKLIDCEAVVTAVVTAEEQGVAVRDARIRYGDWVCKIEEILPADEIEDLEGQLRELARDRGTVARPDAGSISHGLRAFKIFVGGRSIREDRVFVLRMFDRSEEQEQDARLLYLKLVSVYGKAPDQVELMFGLYPGPEAFFRNEPTWDVQFPARGDRSFRTAPPEDKRFRGSSGI